MTQNEQANAGPSVTVPRVALVGYGYWGTNIARNLHQLGALAAIVDELGSHREKARETFPGIPLHESIDTVLADPGMQGVAIATPATTHAQLTQRSLEAGKDVFVEKPLALTLQDGQSLVEEARKRSAILMVGHLLEYHPAVEEIEARVLSGELGALQYIYSNRLNWGRLRREESILWSFAPHDIAVILRLVGSTPTRVMATGGAWIQPDVRDVTVTHMEFAGGIKAHLYVSWLHPHKEQRLVVTGDRNVLVFEDSAPDPERKLRRYSHSVDWEDHAPVARKAPEEFLEYDRAEPLKQECLAFLNAIRTRKAPRTDGESGLRVLQVLNAAEQSLNMGGCWVDVDGPLQQKEAHFVHHSATIDDQVSIGNGSRIWHYCHLSSGAVVGENCTLGQNIFVAPDSRIGSGVRIQNNVSIYAGVCLEDDVFVGPSAVFTNVKNPRSSVSRKSEFDSTKVGRGATIGANATIVCGVEIGEFSLVGAGSVVTSNIPAHAVYVGNPARQKGWACHCGECLEGKGHSFSCKRCGNHYEEIDSALVLKKLEHRGGEKPPAP